LHFLRYVLEIEDYFKPSFMKQPALLVFFSFVSAFLFGQIPAGPVYLLFNSTCMNQLEYRYAYSGAQLLAYSIQSAPDKQLILYSGSNGVNAPALPAGTLDCTSMKLDPAFVDAVNKNQKQVYMVHQTQTGYLMMPLISALQVERIGSYFYFRGANYQFAIDTLNLVYQANLSSTGSPNQVYFAGLQIKDCLYQYAFRGEPTQAGKEKTEFEFIPGIGMISERTGMTTNDMESNQTRLWFVNGMSLDNYIAQKCGTQGQSNILPSDLTYLDRPTEPKPQPIPAPASAAPCPESSGPGYHIVQPKETLNAISRKYKVPLASLIKWNGITAPDKIEICQKVFVVNPATLKLPTPAPLPVAPPPPAAVPKPATPMLHTVKQGESLYSIAKLYNYTEMQLRQFNGFPLSGSITLYPGQKLLLSETEKTTPPVQTPRTILPAPLPIATTPPPATTPPATGGYNNPPPATTPPATGGYNTPPPASAPSAPPKPSQYNTPPLPGSAPQNNTGAFIPPGGNTPPTEPPQSPATMVIYQEYVVQKGDTMQSVARKFKTTAQELALINNKEVNESLIVGQRILAPK
jgi:LysM repeat protein